MKNFIFENSTKIFLGEGCVKEYLCCLVSRYGENIMFCYGKGSVKENGVYSQVMESLKKAGKNVVEFSGIMTNPTYEKVLEGAGLAREREVDLILGAGGGSVMDCCKAIAMAAVYEGDLWEDYFARPGILDFEPLPVGVIVTAAGTGSEMNGNAVITNEKKKIKTGQDYLQCNPRFALMDPVYTYGVPIRQMVSGGFTTLSHIMESYFGKPYDDDNVSDDMAEALMKGVIRDMRAAMKDPQDYRARSNLMWQASMAGNRMLNLGKQADLQCRHIGNQLGAYTDCNHGEGLAVLHPVYYRRIYKGGLFRFRQFAVDVWGIEEEGKSDEELALAGVEALADFIREMGLPAALQELGISETVDLKAVADSCYPSWGSNGKMTHEEILGMLRECRRAARTDTADN